MEPIAGASIEDDETTTKVGAQVKGVEDHREGLAFPSFGDGFEVRGRPTGQKDGRELFPLQ